MTFHNILIAAPLALSIATLTGCQFNSIVYRADVQQGNLITTEMLSQLEVGMTEQQVVFIMGEPLLRSQLHTSRWDYTYYLNPRYGTISTRKVTLWFDDAHRLARIENDPLPTEHQADRMILDHDSEFKAETKTDAVR